MKNNLTNNPNTIVRVALIAALAAALSAAASSSFAAGSGAPGAAVSGATHGGSHARSAHAGHNAMAGSRGSRNAGWGLWGYGPAVYGATQPAGVEPVASVGALSEHVTYTYDVPWDAVHRYPPAMRPYEDARGCHTQQQSVPRAGGGTQAVDIVRCY
jgi:hypothetical protein